MDKKVCRIMDVNLNRMREGMRVCEEVVRFIVEDEELTKRFREVRHSITALVKSMDGMEQGLVVSRDSDNDIGAAALEKTPRSDFRDVFLGNIQRVKEAARVLEEFSKLIKPSLSREFQGFRFNIYSLEKETVEIFSSLLVKAARYEMINLHPATLTSIYAIVDNFDKASLAVDGGAEVVQLRNKKLSDAKLLSLAERIRKLTLLKGVLFIVNDRPDIAAAVEADGVHLGQDDMPIHKARRIVGDKIVGRSTHSLEQALEAQQQGADYIGIGPIFATPTKSDYKPVGLNLISQVKDKLKIPFVAIGGIDVENVGEVIAAGAARIAVVRAVVRMKELRKKFC